MNGSLSKWLRICAGLLLVVGVVAAGLYLTTSPQEGISAFAWLLPAGLYFMLAIGLSLVLLAVAQQYEKPVDMPRELFDALTQMGDAINTLNTQVSQLAQTIDQMRQSPADGESAPAAYPPHNPTDSAQLSEQINELRRLVLMSESQRQALLTQHQHQQFNQTLETIQRQIADRQFGSAERLMGELSEHQSSPELAELRQRLARGFGRDLQYVLGRDLGDVLHAFRRAERRVDPEAPVLPIDFHRHQRAVDRDLVEHLPELHHRRSGQRNGFGTETPELGRAGIGGGRCA